MKTGHSRRRRIFLTIDITRDESVNILLYLFSILLQKTSNMY